MKRTKTRRKAKDPRVTRQLLAKRDATIATLHADVRGLILERDQARKEAADAMTGRYQALRDNTELRRQRDEVLRELGMRRKAVGAPTDGPPRDWLLELASAVVQDLDGHDRNVEDWLAEYRRAFPRT